MIGAPGHIALLSLPVLVLMRVAYRLRGATGVQRAWAGLKDSRVSFPVRRPAVSGDVVRASGAFFAGVGSLRGLVTVVVQERVTTFLFALGVGGCPDGLVALQA